MPHDYTARQVRIALIQGREQGSPTADLDYTVARIREAATSGAQIPSLWSANPDQCPIPA